VAACDVLKVLQIDRVPSDSSAPAGENVFAVVPVTWMNVHCSDVAPCAARLSAGASTASGRCCAAQVCCAGAADGRGRRLHGRAGRTDWPGRAARDGVPGCAQPRSQAARHALRWRRTNKEDRRKRETDPTAPLLQDIEQAGCLCMCTAGDRRAPASMQSVAGEELPSAYQLPPGRAARCALPACWALKSHSQNCFRRRVHPSRGWLQHAGLAVE